MGLTGGAKTNSTTILAGEDTTTASGTVQTIFSSLLPPQYRYSSSLMSQQIPVEQDQNLSTGGDELPTYDDLAAQSGPNSRQVVLSVYSQRILSPFLQIRTMEGLDREEVSLPSKRNKELDCNGRAYVYRAAERYMDISPQERYRRRERGWGNDDEVRLSIDSSCPHTQSLSHL